MKTICLLLTATLATVLAGCALPGPAPCGSTGPADLRGQELRILDHGAFDGMFAAIRPAFEARTGARLTQIEGEDAGEALRRSIEAKGNPIADVIYGIDNALFPEAARAGILEAYESPRVAAIRSFAEEFRRDGRLLATPADYAFVSVNYDLSLNASVPSEEMPRTLRDLASPRWARELVVEDPRLSSPGLGFLLSTVGTFGENNDYDYLDYWQELLRNGVLVADDWSAAYVVHFSGGYGKYEAGHQGDRRLVVSYTTSPAYEAYFSEDKKPPTASFEPPQGVFRQVETVAILTCTQQLPLAKAFVDFVLSYEFQNRTSVNMAVYPVLADAEVIPEFETFATRPAQIVAAPVSPAQLEHDVPRWLDAWTQLYERERA